METISVHDLLYDRSLNPRLHGVDQEVVEFYSAMYQEVHWPPILVHRGTNKLLDGWHRVEAAKRAGVYSLAVQWVEAKDEELFALAVKANLGHGLRLTREERYRAIHRLQREGWTPERIVGVLGCSSGMVARTEKAEDLRIALKVQDRPGAMLPTETLVEITRLPQEYHQEIAELACEVEAAPADVRRAVRAIRKNEVESPQDIRRAMTDPEFLKTRHASMLALGGSDNWLVTFAAMLDHLEGGQVSVTPVEQEAAATLFRRMRAWIDRQLSRLGADETPAMF